MGFEIISDDLPEVMYPGLFLSYRVSPMFGIPMRWVSEITHIQPLHYFIDEQRIGPYRIWHHEHHVKALAHGVGMTDIIHYQPPFGMLGGIANTILIRRQLQSIFTYRRQCLESIFGGYPG